MNRLGRLLKTIRIEKGELLFNMAQRLNVSSAFLSAVENDKRSAPTSWISILAEEYDLSPERYQELVEAVNESNKQVRLNVSNVTAQKRDCALAFARNFDDFSDDEISEIMDVMRKRRG